MKKILNFKGYTLIELITSLAIFSIVMMLVFSLYTYSIKAYNNTKNRYQSQSNDRYAIDITINRIRNATMLEIIDVNTAKAQVAQNLNFSYLYIENGNLYFFIRNSSVYDQFSYSYNLDVSTSSAFTKNGDYSLGILLKSITQNQSYSSNTKITLSNMKIRNTAITGNQGDAIKFLLPE